MGRVQYLGLSRLTLHLLGFECMYLSKTESTSM